MTPKEKSKELIEKYLQEVRGADRYNYNLEDMNFFIAKQCALVAVNEILSMGIFSDSGDWRMAKSYWEEVKQEIEKL